MRQLMHVLILVVGCSEEHAGHSELADGAAGSDAAAAVALDAPAERAPAWSTTLEVPIEPGSEGAGCIDVASPGGRFGGWRVHLDGFHHIGAWLRDSPMRDGFFPSCGSFWQYEHVLTAVTANEQADYRGYAFEMTANRTLTIDLHYLSTSDVPTTATAYLEFLEADAGAPTAYPLTLDGLGGPTLAAGESRTVTFAEDAPAALRILALRGHGHAHNLSIAASVFGSEIYRSENWAEPAYIYPDALYLDAGASFAWSCEILNDSTHPLSWGRNAVETSEMCGFNGISSVRWTNLAP